MEASFKIKFSQQYIANIIGVAWNSQILPEIALKGIWLPFATALKGISDPLELQEGIRLPHAILFDFHGFFGFCMQYLIPFCKLQKGIW